MGRFDRRQERSSAGNIRLELLLQSERHKSRQPSVDLCRGDTRYSYPALIHEMGNQSSE